MRVRNLAGLTSAVIVIALVVALYIVTRPRDEPAGTPTVARSAGPPSPTMHAPSPPRAAAPVDALASAAARIDADDPRRAAAREQREQLLRKIEDPTAGYEPWDDRGLAVLDAVARDGITATRVGCYMAGCAATFTFPSEAGYHGAVDALERSADYLAWTGGKQVTAPEVLADGHVVAAIVLQRPD